MSAGYGNRRAGWLFIGPFWISWGPQSPIGRWTLRFGRAPGAAE